MVLKHVKPRKIRPPGVFFIQNFERQFVCKIIKQNIPGGLFLVILAPRRASIVNDENDLFIGTNSKLLLNQYG